MSVRLSVWAVAGAITLTAACDSKPRCDEERTAAIEEAGAVAGSVQMTKESLADAKKRLSKIDDKVQNGKLRTGVEGLLDAVKKAEVDPTDKAAATAVEGSKKAVLSGVKEAKEFCDG